MAELGKLARCTLTISQRAYQTGGITNPAKFHRKLKNQGAHKEVYRFATFERDGKDCYQCGTGIKRVVVGARRLYYCAQCQAVIRPLGSTE